MIVIDASAAVEMLLQSRVGHEVEAALIASHPVITPVHFDAEVYGTLRRVYLQRRLDRDRLLTAIDWLERFDAERVEIVSLLPNVVGLVDMIGAHDVFYVLLAISRACPLLTCDMPLARAASRLGIEVFAIDRSRQA